MPIKGLSDQRDFPRGGKIKIGERIASSTGGERPNKLDHFRFCPIDPGLYEPWNTLYGAEPKVIPVLLPSDNPEDVFPQFLRRWGGNNKCQCYGDGVRALAREGEGWQDIPCDQTCQYLQKEKCKPEGTLRVLLPELPTLGIFELKAATHSIRRINSCLSLILGVCGHLQNERLLLSLLPVKCQKGTIYMFQLDAQRSYLEMMQGRSSLALEEEPERTEIGEEAIDTATGEIFGPEPEEDSEEEEEAPPANGKKSHFVRFATRCAELKAEKGEDDYYRVLNEFLMKHHNDVNRDDTETMSRIINRLTDIDLPF